MVVCHCEAINDGRIRSLICDQCTTIADIAARCGAGAQCGGCVNLIQSVIDRHGTDQARPARISGSS